MSTATLTLPTASEKQARSLPATARLDSALSLIAPVNGFGDSDPQGDPVLAYLLPGRLAGLTRLAQLAGQHPGHAFGLFQFVDAICVSPDSTTPGTRPRTHSSTTRLIKALADYTGAPPPEADGPQLNQAQTLLQNLLAP